MRLLATATACYGYGYALIPMCVWSESLSWTHTSAVSEIGTIEEQRLDPQQTLGRVAARVLCAGGPSL